MLFGEKLRSLRQERGLTQPELAEQLGVEQSWLSKIENDKCLPSNQLLESVIEIFGLTLASLLADLDPAFVKSQLCTIPEVRTFLDAQKGRRLHNRKRWLGWSAAACVFGSSLWYAGFAALLIPNGLYEYYSAGVLFRGESRLLFHQPEYVIIQFGLIEMPEDIDPQGPDARPYFDQQKFAYLREIELRRNEVVELTPLYRGENYAVPASFTTGARDIYGNTPATADGFRDFTITATHEHQAEDNKVLQFVGGILLLVGLLGFAADYRLTKAQG